MKIELLVDHHLSGRKTLKRRDEGDTAYCDYPVGGPLFGNTDDGKFYRAVAREIANLAQEGFHVEYGDCQAIDDFPVKVGEEHLRPTLQASLFASLITGAFLVLALGLRLAVGQSFVAEEMGWPWLGLFWVVMFVAWTVAYHPACQIAICSTSERSN